ncbi:TIGR01906 family membrane protein [Arthrobacter sp. MYb227]|nr:TIGR01906 family membrane protein [Arthrobacter sp. MYb227]
MIPVEPEKPAVAPSSTATLPAVDQAALKANVPAPEAAVVPPLKANSEMTAAAVAEARNRVFGAYSPTPEPSPAARERRAAREAALGSKPPLARTLQVILAVIYPFVLLIVAIRAVASSAFLWAAYQRPGFPADGFGFSTADRLTYGSYGVDYLNNVADSRYLGELRDPLGNPLFLNTEVQHMVDVKNVISLTYASGAILALIMIFVLFYLGKSYAGGIRRGLFAGAISTIALFGGLTALAILGWDAFFTGFHNIFFANGTWTFNYSDTLIRLYPPQFWVDAAITIGGLVMLVSVITLIFTWPSAKRREKSRLRQEARVFGLK